jgi:CRISPR-associated protein Cas5d
VQYVIEAYFEITLRAGSEDNVNKFVEIFQRRLERGQHFQQPYLGCREFIAEVMPVSEPVKPIKDNRDLGLMLGDIQYYAKGNRAVFFRAQLVNGALEIPEAITAVKK